MALNSDEKSMKILQKFAFSADLPLSNSLRWSQSNRLIGLNLKEKLVIFQVNVNYATNKSTVNRKQLNEENLKIYYGSITPGSRHAFDVGKLANYELSSQEGYVKNLKKPGTCLKSFDFSPSNVLVDFNLVGVITDDFCLLLYIQLGSQDWRPIHNLTVNLNEYLTENKWKPLNSEIDFCTYIKRLDSYEISSFCWHSHPLYGNKEVEFQIFSATKTGDIYWWKITLSNEDNFNPRCESKIEKFVHTELMEIVTLKQLGNCLFAESHDGRSVLFDLRDTSLSTFINLWDESDFRPSYDVCLSKCQSGFTEIVFCKFDFIVHAQLSMDFHIEFLRRKSWDELGLPPNFKLLSIYNYEGSREYCGIEYNSAKVWQISLPQDNSKISLNEITFADFTFGPAVTVNGFGSSTNCAMRAFVSYNREFCSTSHVVNNVQVIFCTQTSLESVCQILTEFIAFPMGEYNLFDYLYLFRCYLSQESANESVWQLLHYLLDKFSKFEASPCEAAPNNQLLYLKIVRFLIRRYWEISLSPESTPLDTNTCLRIENLLNSLNRHIIQQNTEQALMGLLEIFEKEEGETSKDKGVSFLTCEQLVSLCNIHRQSSIINTPKSLIAQVQSLAGSKDKLKQKKLRSTFGRDYLSNLSKPNSLLDIMNRCPYCEKVFSAISLDIHCPNHRLDVCTNSLLVSNPAQDDPVQLDLCGGCFESKLIYPRIWPSFTTAPFHYMYDRCLFCL